MNAQEKNAIKVAFKAAKLTDTVFKRVIRRKCCCCYCGSSKKIQRHHVTYEPKKIVKLCSNCHRLITVINTIGSIATKTKKDNAVRTRLWDWFIRTKRTNTKFTVDLILAVLEITYKFSSIEKQFIMEARKRISC